MNLNQSNRLTMYGRVISYLIKFPVIISTIRQFAESLERFQSTVDSIRTSETARQNYTPGKTDIKYSAEEDLINSTLEIASALFLYAVKTKNLELKSISKISLRKLEKLKDIDLIIKCKLIYNAANEVKDQLIPFGAAAEDVTILTTKIDTFEKSIGSRDSSVSERTAAGMTVTELFAKADEILEEEIDVCVNMFRIKDNIFYTGYYAARIIKDLGIRHNKNNKPEEQPGEENKEEKETPAPVDGNKA